MIGDLSYQHHGLFRDMLDVCQVRGRDSTGVVKVDRKLDYDYVKDIGPPSWLCDTKQYDKRIDTGIASVLIGHTRSKTSGEVSRKNAHPFDFPEEGIIGVHNGTLRGHHSLDTYTYQKVDSEVLYGHMAKNGPQETFDRLEGAFACVWWNDKEKTLNFFRNKERPLFFCWSEDKKVMFWASEVWMFSVIARKIKLAKNENEDQNWYELPTETLWRFTPEPDAKKDQPAIRMHQSRVIEHNPPKKETMASRFHQSSAAYHKDPVTGEWNKAGNEGGKVADPFELRRRMAMGMWELDDPVPHMGGDSLPWDNEEELARGLPGLPRKELKQPSLVIPSEATGSPITSVDFLTHSARNTASSTEQKSSDKLPRPKLSLLASNSRDSQSNSSGECSRSTAALSRTLKLRLGVSFRNVAGMSYITNNLTSKEWDEVTFLHMTGGKCSFCKEAILNISDVATIIGENQDSFICRSCMKEPAVA